MASLRRCVSCGRWTGIKSRESICWFCLRHIERDMKRFKKDREFPEWNDFMRSLEPVKRELSESLFLCDLAAAVGRRIDQIAS